MKTLFFIAALVAAVYLIMQTPAGKAWLEKSEPEVNIQQTPQNKIKEKQQILQSVENKISVLAQQLTETQQAQIKQLEGRIAELENEVIMGRINNKQPQSVSSSNVILHPFKQPIAQPVIQPYQQGYDAGAPAPDTLAVTADNQLQRNRQAKLQDIAQKMEMSSLQALVN